MTLRRKDRKALADAVFLILGKNSTLFLIHNNLQILCISLKRVQNIQIFVHEAKDYKCFCLSIARQLY